MIFLCLYEVCLFLLLFHLCLGFSKSTLAVLITCYCLVQIFFIEVRRRYHRNTTLNKLSAKEDSC